MYGKGENYMAKVTVNFKTEEDVKQKFDQICDELGITMSAAINLFLKQVIIQEQIPFEITSKKKIRTDFLYQDGQKVCMIETEGNGNQTTVLDYLKKLLEPKS